MNANQKSAQGLETLGADQRKPNSYMIPASELAVKQIPPKKPILLPWLFDRNLVMVYAWRGVGKSWFTLEIANAVARGTSFIGWEAPQSRRVLYIDGEMTANDLQERLRAINTRYNNELTDPEKFVFFSGAVNDLATPNLLDTKTQETVFRVCVMFDLIIIDNLSCLFRGGGNENDSTFADPIIGFLLKLRSLGKSVIVIHHAGKNNQQRGTSKKEDILDVVINLEGHESLATGQSNRFSILFKKNRSAKNCRNMDVEMTEVDNGVWWSFDNYSHTDSKKDPLLDLAHLKELPAQGLSAKEISLKLSMGESTIYRKLKQI